jgi:hypothetical protein
LIDVEGKFIQETYTVTLHKGWNQIGNPFTFPVAWKEVIAAEGEVKDAVEDVLWRYTGKGYKPVDTFIPWEGYWVKAKHEVTLKIPPSPSEISPTPAAGHTLRAFRKIGDSDSAWLIQLVAGSEKCDDMYNFIGTLHSASDGYDLQDISEPPPISPYVSVYFLNKGTKCAVDIRNPITTVKVWEVVLKTDVDEEIILSWKGVDSVPSKFSVYLVTESGFIDMRQKNSCRVRGDNNFKIYVGLSEYIPVLATTSLGKVLVYPNPFKPSEGHEFITFGGRDVPQERRLTPEATIRIYTMTGELVKTIVEDDGDGEERWKAVNEAGEKVASGIYIYVITNPKGEKCIGKLVIIR